MSGKAAARHATGELASRDAKVLGDVLKIRFFPLAVDNAEGYIVTDVDGRRHLDFVVGDRWRTPATALRGRRSCDLPNARDLLWRALVWPERSGGPVGRALDPPDAQRFEEWTWFAVCAGHGRTPQVLRFEHFGAASDAVEMCTLEGLEEATRQRTKIVDGVADKSSSWKGLKQGRE